MTRTFDGDRGDRSAPAIAERLARLIRIATVASDDPAADAERFAALRAELAAAYPLAHERLRVERIGERSLLYVWDPPAEPDAARPAPLAEGPLVLMAHQDVVPASADDGWSRDPFSGEIADGFAHGRGALDDKGPLVVILEAVERLLADGFAPARPLVLSFGGDEETMGGEAELAADRIAELGLEPWLVLDEGGAVVDSPIPLAEGEFAMIGLGEKGLATVRLSCRGEPGHASAPSPDSAPSRIARAIRRLEARPFPARATAPVLGMLRAFAEASPSPAAARGLRALAAAPALAARALAAGGAETAAMVRTTCAVTMLEAGTAPNVIASEARATLNLRILPGETPETVRRRLRRIIRDPEIAIEFVEASAPSPLSPADGPQFGALRAALAESHPEAIATPYLMMQASDARLFHRRWPHVYRFAPLRMPAELRATIHGIDERVAIEELGRGARFHEALIRATLGAGAARRMPDDAGARHPDADAHAAGDRP